MRSHPRPWSALAGTPLAAERAAIESGDIYESCEAAGLQFYAYGESDGLGGRVLPAAGDRLSLVRRPDNRADSNAVEIWWRNQHMLGHLPRKIAWQVAPAMDHGIPLRAYVSRPGDGGAWSMEAVLIGPALATHDFD